MTDKSRSHLSDPLGYLYEEIPPEAMAEARKHLAQCPECLKNVKAVRETVKAYRGLPRAETPTDLKDRLMRRARDAAKRPAERPAELSPVPAPSREDPEPLLPAAIYHEEIEQIESMRRFRWRTWFFHPAWTVAATVVFVCSVLIHLSPRRTLWFDEGTRSGTADHSPQWRDLQATAASSPGVAARPRAARRPELPASDPLPRFELPEASEPVPPPHRFELPEAAENDKFEIASALPPRVIQNLPPPSPAASVDIPAPETPMAAAPARPPALILEEAAAPAPAPPAWAASYYSPPPDESVAAADSAGVQVEEGALAGALYGGHRRDGELGDGGIFALKEMVTAAGPVILDYFSAEKPPPIVERPEPIDKDKLALDLVFLAGMQMGKHEFAEAAGTIGLLAPLNPEKAGELLVMLDSLATAEEARAASEPEPEPPADEAAAEAPAPDEPPEDSPPPDPEPVEPAVDDEPDEVSIPEPDSNAEHSAPAPDETVELDSGKEPAPEETEESPHMLDEPAIVEESDALPAPEALENLRPPGSGPIAPPAPEPPEAPSREPPAEVEQPPVQQDAPPPAEGAVSETSRRIAEIVGGILGVGLERKGAVDAAATPADRPEALPDAGDEPETTAPAEPSAPAAETAEVEDEPAASPEAEPAPDPGPSEDGPLEEDGGPVHSEALDDPAAPEAEEPVDGGIADPVAPEPDGAAVPLSGFPVAEPAEKARATPFRSVSAVSIPAPRRPRPFSTDPYVRGD